MVPARVTHEFLPTPCTFQVHTHLAKTMDQNGQSESSVGQPEPISHMSQSAISPTASLRLVQDDSGGILGEKTLFCDV